MITSFINCRSVCFSSFSTAKSCIKAHIDSEYYLVEINPRIPAWVYLAVGAGQNIPEALIKLALGINVQPMKSYKIGKMFVRYSYDMIVDLERFAAISMNKEI